MRFGKRLFAVTAGGFLATFGHAATPAFAGPFGTGFDFTFNVPATDYGRPPKPGEHLGDYLIAEQLPVQTQPVREVRLPQTTVPLPSPELQKPITYLRVGSRSPEWDRPQQPKLGDLPPKPGECLGEYALASELPPRYTVTQPNLPTMAVPPEHQIEIGYRFDAPSNTTAPTPTVTLLPPVPVPHAIEVLPPFGQIGYGRTLPTTSNLELLKFLATHIVKPDGEKPPMASKPRVTERTAINFTGPTGMKVSWQLPDGSFKDDKDSLTTPKEWNFVRGQVYRMRLTNVLKDKPGRVFYPTLEVAPAMPKTATFLKHSSVPVSFTADDFAQAKQGFLVVKVIYLPDPSNEDFATVVGAEELVSTRLEPGVDPIAEAQRRGSVLAVIRLGNIDLENRVSPSMTAPPPGHVPVPR